MSTKLVGAAAVILDAEGRILLVKHNYGKFNWEIPGGLSEKDESAEDTAKREVFEETGLEVTVGRLTGVYYESAHDMHHFAFICTINDNQEPQPDAKEVTECKYFSIDDLPRPISDFTVKRIQEALNPNYTHLFHNIGPRQWFE
ncbi:ADP-ribose pyrophosphatase YjhB (NUDIX family) [Paenibacillus taihuensis]|uniref:ADP-ribose pyrophosphatase YjhB (NUDIX family) n=1 Tax=Paenibacillus taihuensis TaxID=1156355 RepID=A0A3D9R4I5_9BACL|nr:NUDIX domain-containing protein [Paenibacillus taihuensis]REE68747.1 ADP-ribose pyrophosphatase YjhB (NUDIX family) [Paenibacillus taihuensis]